MIDAGVFISIIGSQLRIARRETGPQFAADRRAKTADKEVIITAGIRRPDPVADIPYRQPVFIPGEIHMLQPGVGKNLAVNARLVHFIHDTSPEHLQIKIVVGNHIRRNRIIKREAQRAFSAFIGLSESAADSFAQPAADYLPAKFNVVHNPVSKY